VIGYVIRRVLGVVLLLFLLSLVVFALFSLVPADPAAISCGQRCTPTKIAENREKLGLNDPVLVQYQKYVTGIFAGREFSPNSPQPIECSVPCLGYSFVRQDEVTDLIVNAIPVTFWLAVGGFVIWIITGLTLGIYAALKRGKWQDRTIMVAALVGYSLPSFFIGLVLIFFIILQWGLLPYPQFQPPDRDPVRFIQTMILPWTIIAVLNAAFYVRLTRNQVLEVLGEDYVRTARAKGLRERTVVVKHALRAGLTPIVTAAGLDLAYLLGGAIITESLFSLPGLGSLAVNSVLRYDLPVTAGITIVTAAFIIVANLVVDLLYGVIDPRVRVG
jgi:peptide/nickel transport system permease protein